jgi:N-acyl homoserine lactone hydrolase
MFKVLVSGYPGRSATHGGLGWSTISLARLGERVVLIDAGSFGIRRLLQAALREQGLEAGDVTDVLLTHSHYDHSLNYILFPNARVWISGVELDWATSQHPDFTPLPELYMEALSASGRLRVIESDGDLFEGVRGIMSPGHTPGSVAYEVEEGPEKSYLVTGDAVKNRAELLSGTCIDTLDRVQSERSIQLLTDLWRSRPENVLIPGHDLPIAADAGGPKYLESREASIGAWLGTDLTTKAEFNLTDEGVTQ